MTDSKKEITNIIGMYWVCDNGKAYIGDTVQVKTTWGSIHYGEILSAAEDGGFMLNDIYSMAHSLHIRPNTIRKLIFVKGNNGRYHARYDKN